MTRIGVDRILRYAFELARRGAADRGPRRASHVGDEVQRDRDLDAVLGRAGARDRRRPSPMCGWDQFHIDALVARLVLTPDQFDVIVASNLFGDILSDLGPALTGTIGIAPSANINPRAAIRPCSSPSTARPRTSPAAGSPTRSGRSGRCR